MKRLILLLVIPVLALVGCNRDDDFGGNNEIKPVPFTVNIKYDASKYPSVADKGVANVTVILKNTATEDQIIGKTDANGELKLDAVLPGSYSIQAELQLKQSEYEQQIGEETSYEIVHFGGFDEKVTINANTSSKLIRITSGNLGDLVIKQYYYAGSDNKLGANFRDQFIEVHNNSDQTIYADGLYLVFLEGNVNSNVTTYTLSNGQYDWSKTAGGGAAANTDYVYSNILIKIPGNGSQYPILPGKSIIVAQTAINHKMPFDDINGTGIPIQEPDKTVDLSHADFETYMGDYNISIGKKPFAWDIQNIMVPDMQVAYWSIASNDLILNVNSMLGLGILRATDAEVASWQKVAAPKAPTGTLFLQIPKNYIIDGIDITDKEQKVPKDFPADIDASRTFIVNSLGQAEGTFTGFSVIRKTKEIVNGRMVLQDTNNSANDFVTIKANPRGYAQ
ncbi:DUF4876 domain-containing protein (plasmid) [Chryseobacterium panacisoli]|jgi:hypothetical protein|uniref:DUF4876 domain-containing protein n=1 Tax=Chryseobacterium panacisoli TaxID=1807141 RepID=A0A5D8ZYU0_9FLAO|nr:MULTISPECIES: DUF4876 domain-containing protein [Chryseobacterium]QXU51260.1 DUF4876 domain-containing protein [Chryseobacterium sp. D764]TZF99691.1 DUF4876 domain-containing protein [Chryseobacterium panacisoli]CAD0220817.1 conserved protein of unknown function [Chryseobacterium sp. JV274]